MLDFHKKYQKYQSESTQVSESVDLNGSFSDSEESLKSPIKIRRSSQV